jgi:hypothetical protein
MVTGSNGDLGVFQLAGSATSSSLNRDGETIVRKLAMP